MEYNAPSVPGGGKTVAMTFDDGPGPSTAAIIKILERFHARATFFNVGESEARWPGLVKEEQRDGYLVGNHTWDHPQMTLLSPTAQASELDKVIHEQRKLVGTSPCVFRPPYGEYSATTLKLVRKAHMSLWLWDVDPQDWEADGSGSAYWVNHIIATAEREGGALRHPVVDMHNQSIPMPATVAALPTILEFFKSHHYTFVDLLGRHGPPRPSSR